MTRNRIAIVFVLLTLLLPGIAAAQISSFDGDIEPVFGTSVLNAPYRGTVTSLREATADFAYGEVLTAIEPPNPDAPLSINSADVKVWRVGTWDRSVVRLYQGLDASGYSSGQEIDMTNAVSEATAVLVPRQFGQDFVRFSLKAIATKSLAPQKFIYRVKYTVTTGTVDQPREIIVVPTTGSFARLPGLSEAYLLGTPLLEVTAGKAQLTVPIGRTAEMVGTTFNRRKRLGNNSSLAITTENVVFPGAAESVYIQPSTQFFINNVSSTGPSKAHWGTPWVGYLIGYFASVDIFGPDGTQFDFTLNQGAPNGCSQSIPQNGPARFDFIRPYRLATNHAATQRYLYSSCSVSNNWVTEIRDQGSAPNRIVLNRVANVVDHIYVRSGSDPTSNLRGWAIQSDGNGRITGIVPDGSNGGARFFSYNSAGRCTEVRDATNVNVMYQFTYTSDVNGDPTILAGEKRYIDATAQVETAVEHDTSNGSLYKRKEYVASGEYRQTDFAYDTTTGGPDSSLVLNNRPASITTYAGTNGTGTSYTTTFTHDVSNPAGTMNLTQVSLPSSVSIAHLYDAHVDTEPNQDSDAPQFGYRTKTTWTGTSGSLITLDRDYDFVYVDPGDGRTKVYQAPRLFHERDGRHNSPTFTTEITYNFEPGGSDTNGDGLNGEQLNQLLSKTGPTIQAGTSGTRSPQTQYTYATGSHTLTTETVAISGSTSVQTTYGYDAILRLTSKAVDPTGVNSITQYQYTDNTVTQDRIVFDPDNYYTKTTYDNDGRVVTIQRFLTAGGTGGTDHYDTINTYDTNGRLSQQTIDNKDQVGTPLSPATIATTFTYDRLGRLITKTVNPGGIGQESHFVYNWQGDITREYDTSSTSERGVTRTYDGRGLIATEVPLATGQSPVAALTTTFEYSPLGLRTRAFFSSQPARGEVQTVYDDFARVSQRKRVPGTDGGHTFTTTFTYDNANGVTRTVVDESSVGTLSDSTALFDEGGFNYESRQRLAAGSDGSNDPVMRRKFDFAGNVTEERSLGDSFVADRVIGTQYDTAMRVSQVSDAEGGLTTYTRDDRGNILTLTVKIEGSTNAVTTNVYDALGRVKQTTDPQGHDRVRFYDSRNNLLRESARNTSDQEKHTTVFGYDAAGRQTRQAVLHIASAATDAASASTLLDRVTDFTYDADGRLLTRTFYQGSPTPVARTTTTTHDTLGRVDRVTDPSGNFSDDDYATNGRRSQRVVNDSGGTGSGDRTFTYAFDGHDRVIGQTAVGTPNLTTTFALDGVDRTTSITDPRGLTTTTSFDLAGRQTSVIEDAIGGGALQRQTDYAYDRLSQLITQTAKNKSNGGATLADQVTQYRYDTMDRLLRTAYPDAGDISPSCADCVKNVYDLAGRVTSMTDQRGVTTTMTYDLRGLVLTKSVASANIRDTYTYDALSRAETAQRGTTTVSNATSSSTLVYNDLGDLTSETQTIGASGTPRTIAYQYDQAGNRTLATYPSSVAVGYTPTQINQVGAMTLNSNPLVAYSYVNSGGQILDKRRITTSAAGGNTYYDFQYGYDTHHRVGSVTNSFVPNGASPSTVASYSFVRDGNGNPTQQTASGQSAFASDDRDLTIDRLNRLLATAYTTLGGNTETQALDRAGNRETYTPRVGASTTYTVGNPANEYATVAGISVQHDNAGNLTVDEAGRQYAYDEQNRLTQVKTAGNVVLVDYTYDGLGRRISAVFDPASTLVTVRYYYDGPSVVEERNGSDARVRYHVHGGQFIDEHVATFNDGTSSFVYYLHNDLYTVVGVGGPTGSIAETYTYSGYGVDTVTSVSCLPGDMDDDSTVDAADMPQFITVLLDGSTDPHELCAADINGDGSQNGLDIQPFVTCLLGGGCPPVQGGSGLKQPFTLHGVPVDVLSDGLVLQYNRARYYDVKNARWLHRDPVRYVGGNNLYEGFRSNPATFTDPSGKYTKLASGWHSGDEVFYQRIILGTTTRNFSVGNYYYNRGQKYIVYDGSIDFNDDYLYVLDFKQVESWSKAVADEGDYERFVARQGVRIDRRTGKVTKRTIGEDIANYFAELTEQRQAQIEALFNSPQAMLAGPAYTLLTGEDLATERTVPARFRVLAGAETALQVAPMAIASVQALRAGGSVARAGAAFPGGPLSVAESAAAESAGASHGTAPMTGYTWNQVLQTRYGAANVEWVAPKLANEPLTLGVLRTPAGDFGLASGWNGYAGMMPKGAPGFNRWTRTHVEGHAAALMQKQNINEGILWINNPRICTQCNQNLPYMLQPGRTLDVVIPDGTSTTFTGALSGR
jgi:RHS repeat-associated protein